MGSHFSVKRLIFPSGRDPDNWALTYQVYQRRFTNALVLYKPLSYGGNVTGTTTDNTATTFRVAWGAEVICQL